VCFNHKQNNTIGGGKGGHLDCTHSIGGDGLYGVHPYFVQAIIDDYFENQ
jgi:hypothetical protein